MAVDKRYEISVEVFDTNCIPPEKSSRLYDISIELCLVIYVWKFLPEREECLDLELNYNVPMLTTEYIVKS